MKHHEREFLISQIRTGNLYIIQDNLELIIKPPTLEQTFKANLIQNKSYEQAQNSGIMTEAELHNWMLDRGLWSIEEEEKITGLQKDLERLKKEAYNARNDTKLKNRIKLYLRAGEKQLSVQLAKKNLFFSQSCEGIATSDKTAYIIENTTYKDNVLFNFNTVSLQYVIDEWYSALLSENQTRELVRNEPWRSIWNIRQKGGITLFDNQNNMELTSNQKQIIIWSQIYDNVQESLDCPSTEIIEDDDMLDGWFIIQAEKREKEKTIKEVDSSIKNSKIKNASEVFVTVNTQKEKERIDSLNNIHTKNIKNQRLSLLQDKKHVKQQDFEDEKLKLRTQRNNMLRNK